MSAVCEGCHRIFTKRGLKSHLRQSQDALCQIYADKVKQTAKSWRTLTPIPRTAETDEDDDPLAAAPFSGDFFGTAADYQEDNFGQDAGGADPAAADKSELASPSSDSEESDNDDDPMARLLQEEHGWEAPRQGAPQHDIIEPDFESNEPEAHGKSDKESSDSDNASGHSDSSGPIIESEDESLDQELPPKPIPAMQTPTFSVRKIVHYNTAYPSSAAGTPIPGAAPHPTTDARYTHAIHGQTNIWAPFQSRNDWEVARWAKLRGKGSSAFNELLAIPGVRFEILCHAQKLNYKLFLDCGLPHPILSYHETIRQDYRQSIAWPPEISETRNCNARRSNGHVLPPGFGLYQGALGGPGLCRRTDICT